MLGPRCMVSLLTLLMAGCSACSTNDAPRADPPSTPPDLFPPRDGAADTDEPPLTRDEIRTVVRAKLPQVRGCFAATDVTPEAALVRARVELQFTIGPDGKARDVSVVETNLPDRAPAACLVAELPRWQFPRPRAGSSVTIRYPFVYSSEAALRAAGLPRVEGTVDPVAVGAVFEARRAELDGCVPQGAHGRLGVAMIVDDGGRVTRIASTLAELPPAATACLLQTLAAWAFPPAAAGDEARINHELAW